MRITNPFALSFEQNEFKGDTERLYLRSRPRHTSSLLATRGVALTTPLYLKISAFSRITADLFGRVVPNGHRLAL